MGKLQALTDSILGKVEATGEAKVSKAKQLNANDLIAFQAHQADWKASQKETIQEREEAGFERKKQSYLNKKRNEKLTLKQELLEEVFTNATAKLAEMPKADFQIFLENAIAKIDQQKAFNLTIGELSKTVIDDEQLSHWATVYPMMAVSNDQLKNKAGFILSQDGIDYNYCFDQLVEDLKSQLIPKLSQHLFK